jgi:hypothetical protein
MLLVASVAILFGALLSGCDFLGPGSAARPDRPDRLAEPAEEAAAPARTRLKFKHRPGIDDDLAPAGADAAIHNAGVAAAGPAEASGDDDDDDREDVHKRLFQSQRTCCCKTSDVRKCAADRNKSHKFTATNRYCCKWTNSCSSSVFTTRYAAEAKFCLMPLKMGSLKVSQKPGFNIHKVSAEFKAENSFGPQLVASSDVCFDSRTQKECKYLFFSDGFWMITDKFENVMEDKGRRLCLDSVLLHSIVPFH